MIFYNPINIDDLKGKISKGIQFQYVYFWGQTSKKQNKIDKSCLSNWYPAAFEDNGLCFYTSEQYLMYHKACLFDDEKIKNKILNTPSPKDAKDLGRKVLNFDEAFWMKHRFDIMIKGLLLKFQQNEELGGYLISTKDKILVEASPYDRIWGVGLSINEASILDPSKWKGLNLLGFALMTVRFKLMSKI